MLLELNISTPEDDYILGVKMDTVEDMSGIHLDDLQRQAVVATQNNGVSIITGGPGTGKTTTINAIIQLYPFSPQEYNHLPVLKYLIQEHSCNI